MTYATVERLTTDPVEDLLVDLVGWIADRPRPYVGVLEAWRTSCPRLPVWEEAVDRGFVRRLAGADGAEIHVTPAGRAFLAAKGRSTPDPKKKPA
jgi:hypothetical protein